MILSGLQIKKIRTETLAWQQTVDKTQLGYLLPNMIITPFNDDRIGANSYDLKLQPTLKKYQTYKYWVPSERSFLGLSLGKMGFGRWVDVIDTLKPLVDVPLRRGAYLLEPGITYLGATVESIECHGLVPIIDGRSSIGRLGISIHQTAGYGDDGFRGTFTLEITCIQPVLLPIHVSICQVRFEELKGARKPYSGRYQNQKEPTASKLLEEHINKLKVRD